MIKVLIISKMFFSDKIENDSSYVRFHFNN